jgi:hypothetical protein
MDCTMAGERLANLKILLTYVGVVPISFAICSKL